MIAGRGGKGFGQDQLEEIRNLIEAEQSDLFDVLAYIAFALPTMTREERLETSRSTIHRHYSDTQQEFLDFVLTHYIAQGVTELDLEKLPSLLELKYHSVDDALPILGGSLEVREVFIGFQGYLYGQKDQG